ncbi:hypothetical protein [Oceanicoccus sp. KOV_DT_Chl]|uniref:hypothetical protein n=1 Tax=Oceanicoccus sp. KOV_DT_Chl TaxID=1904639 RepID=UPI000C7B4914|nr:hypothetical protein [Oceanicoccus sp. KOV_DT_Chl]
MAGENFGFPGHIGAITDRYRMLYSVMIHTSNPGSSLKKPHRFYAAFAIDKQLLHYRQSMKTLSAAN